MNNSPVKYRLLTGFDDPSADEHTWNALLGKNSGNVIFMTHQWQRTWWEVFGRGTLLIIIAEQEQKVIAIAPLFADGGMIFFVGSGGSDYLDLIGDYHDPNVLPNMLRLAKESVSEFLGFRFYHVRGDSITKELIFAAGKVDQWEVFDEGELPAPFLDIKNFPDRAEAATSKKSLKRHEAWFSKNGGLVFEHSTASKDILPHLPLFVEQHIKRWEPTPYPSLFLDPQQVLFYRRITEVFSGTGWLRFTRIIWKGDTIAYHFGFFYARSFLWYKPTFDIALAKHSPGEVLMRQLLLFAITERAEIFDFGLGEEKFKERFATGTLTVKTWGLYSLTRKK